MAIETELYGPGHPEVAGYFGRLGDVLKMQVRSAHFRQRLACQHVLNMVVIIVGIARPMFVGAEQRSKRVRTQDIEGAEVDVAQPVSKESVEGQVRVSSAVHARIVGYCSSYARLPLVRASTRRPTLYFVGPWKPGRIWRALMLPI